MVRLGTARARIVLLAALAVLVSGLAGCAQPVGPVSPGGDPLIGDAQDSIGDLPGSPDVGADCESAGVGAATPPLLTPLAADAVLVSAMRCRFHAEIVPGDGEWLMRVEQEATAGLDALANALRLPSIQPVEGQACRAIGYVPIVITVTDTAGRQIHPAVPQDACGAPINEAVDAIAKLPWTTVATTKARQMRSELEIASGCSGSWKPVIPLIAIEGSGTQTLAIDTTARPMQICRYGLDSDPANVLTLSDGTPYRMGVLTTASTLDAAAGGQLLLALAAAPRVQACAEPEHPFAVLFPSDRNGMFVAIELGGCYRAVFDGENYARQLDAATVAALVG